MLKPPRRRQMWLAIGAFVVIMAMLAILLGVGGDSNNATGTTTTTSPGSTTTTLPFDIKHNARADVVSGACVSAATRWTFSGTVHNGASAARRYQIIVDFTSIPGSTVMDTKVDNIASVAAHQTQPWSVTSSSGLGNVNCVIRYAQSWPAN